MAIANDVLKKFRKVESPSLDSQIISAKTLINIQSDGARESDEYKLIDKNSKFILEKNIPLHLIKYELPTIDPIAVQENRLKDLVDSNSNQDLIDEVAKGIQHLMDLRELILENNCTPIVIDKNYNVIDGYHRTALYKHLGVEYIDVYKEIET